MGSVLLWSTQFLDYTSPRFRIPYLSNTVLYRSLGSVAVVDSPYTDITAREIVGGDGAAGEHDGAGGGVPPRHYEALRDQ